MSRNFIGLACIFAGLLAGGAQAAEKVSVRAWAHDGFGRVVFDWPSKPGFTAKIEEGKLVVRFDRPFEADYASVEKNLKDYIGGITSGEDGKLVSFVLKGSPTLRRSAFDNVVAFDLAGVKASGGAQDKVAVRVGEHSGYSRLVFDWSKPVGYRAVKEGQRVTVAFDKGAELQLAVSDADLPPFVGAISAEGDRDKLDVSFPVPQGSRLRHFRSGNKVVVDILAPPEGKRTAQSPVPAAIAKSDVNKRKTEEAASARPAVMAARNKVQAANLPDPAATAASDKAVAANKPAAKTPSGVAEDIPRSGPRSLIPQAVRSQATRAAPGGPREGAAESDASSASMTGTANRAAKSALASGSPRKTAVFELPRSAKRPAEKVKLKVLPQGDALRLSFPWRKPVALAVFQRAGHIWAVFDRPAAIDMSAVSGKMSAKLWRVEQIADQDATLLKLQAHPALKPVVGAKFAEWHIDLEPVHEAAPANVIQVRSEPDAKDGARVFLPIVDTGRRLALEDKEVGDRIHIIPVHPAGWGVGADRSFVQFKLLKTAQGVVVVPRDPAIDVASLRNGVKITSQDGLMISRGGAPKVLYAEGDETDRELLITEPEVLTFREWRREDAETYTDAKQELQRAIAFAPEAGRNAARLDLAKFYLANGSASDALGVLARILDTDPRADEDRLFRTMRGVAHYMMGHMDAAESDLFNSDLENVAEIALWRGAVAAAKQDWIRSRQEFSFAKEAMRLFRQEMGEHFRLAAARAMLESDDLNGAQEMLVRIEQENVGQLGAGDAAMASYLRGRVYELAAAKDEAIQFYDESIALDYHPLRAQVALDRTIMLAREKELSNQEAIEKLEGIRYSWRGDDYELKLLHNLGRLQIDEGRYREGLGTLRKAVTYFPEVEEARSIAREMSETFADLFLQGKADKMSPVSALALYYEFKELTPVGARGDEMIRKLADRLVSVDLLSRAAKLLDHQVNFRLKGVQKSAVATQLAVIYLLDRKPEEALKILRGNNWRGIPPEMDNDRRYLETRALTDLNHYDKALKLIGGDQSHEANLLRSDINWRAKNWADAAKSFSALLGERWKKKEALNGLERQWVMQQAVSMSLANDLAGLKSLRENYRAMMADVPEVDAFDVITDQVNRDDTEFRQLASTIARVNQLEAFMVSYREKLQKGGFGAVN